MKLHSSINMKLINFDVFLRNRTNSRIGFLGLVRHNNILFVFFTAGFQETLQKIGERDRYPAFS